MRQVHCDGCGFTEPDDLSKSRQTIEPVSLVLVKDHRFPAGTEKFEADLCQNCLGMLKHTYFKVPAEGQLELPAFLGPRMLDNAEAKR
jgi:hypothetical protein